MTYHDPFVNAKPCWQHDAKPVRDMRWMVDRHAEMLEALELLEAHCGTYLEHQVLARDGRQIGLEMLLQARAAIRKAKGEL